MFLKLVKIQGTLIALVLSLSMLAASACGDAQMSLPDSFQVLSSSPENGSTQVSVDSEFILSFSDELELDTLDPGAISLRDEQGLVVNTQRLFFAQNKKLQLVPTMVLHNQSTYYFFVKKGVSGLHQVASLTDYRSRFTTQ